MRKVIIAILLTMVITASWAQVYVEGGKTKHRFAQLNLGVDYRSYFKKGSQTYQWEGNQLIGTGLNESSTGRLIIGGTHFWGHADFYVAFSVLNLGSKNFKNGAETGFKILPWRIEHKKIRPFIGAAWLLTNYQQGEGTSLVRHQFPMQTGVLFNHRSHLLEFTLGRNVNNRYVYYFSPNQSATLLTSPYWISLGYKWIIDTTLSSEPNWKNGKTQWKTDTLASMGRLNGFTLAIGPSSAQFLKSSEHNQQEFNYLDQHKTARIFPEFAAGYYWHTPDVQVNIVYRKVRSGLAAYNQKQTIARSAWSFEAFKFLADYHGFAVFAGPVLSFENLQVMELSNLGERHHGEAQLWRAGLVAGWDIRPNRIKSWYLRTNLRWIPGLDVNMYSGKKVRMDQLEFNFIQLVVLPNRLF